jgi:photosynthetic reaction center H subunit
MPDTETLNAKGRTVDRSPSSRVRSLELPESTGHEGRHAVRRSRRGVGATGVARLGDLPGYEVADGEPDVRSWHVLTREGMRAGEVEDLVVDPQAMQVAYVEVRLDKDALRLREFRHVLVPVRAAWLNEDEELVRLGVSASELVAAPPYDPGSFSRAGENALQRRYARYLSHSSEQELSLGRQRRMAGTLELRKRVESRSGEIRPHDRGSGPSVPSDAQTAEG